MGYLINSTSSRLGLSLKWHQRLFMFTKFYVNGLNQTINFNDYFELFYRQYSFGAMSYTFSHIVWYNHYLYALVNIYVLHGKFEEQADDYFGKMFSKVRRIAKKRKYGSVNLRRGRWRPHAVWFFKRISGDARRIIRRKIKESIIKRYRRIYKPYHKFLPHVLKLRTIYQEARKLNSIVNKRISNDFSKMLGKAVKVQLCCLSNNTITVDTCVRYIKLRLEQFNRFNEIVYPLMRAMRLRMPFVGLRIRCAGRISRQQRASRHQSRFGHTSFNTYSYPVKFGYGSAILKFGMASIRVWLYRRFPKKKFTRIFLNKLINGPRIIWRRKSIFIVRKRGAFAA